MVRIVDTNEADGLVQVETRPTAGKINIGPTKRFWVEPDLLYPLLKGAGDFSTCEVHIDEQLYIIVPNDGINQADYIAAEKRLASLKHTAKYLGAYKALLSQRSTYRLRQKAAPYYSIYNVGAYTFAPYKVVWAEQSSAFEAAVVASADVPLVGSRPYVPDHKIYFADFDDAETAYFVCAVLNSVLVREFIESHTIQIQVSNIFKHVSIPRFDENDALHMAAVSTCKKAHQAKSSSLRESILKELSALTEKILT